MSILKSYFTLFFLGTVLFLTSCKNDGNQKAIDPSIVNNPTNADGTVDKNKLPEITFEKTFHDFGLIKEGEKVSISFKFKNTGKGPLVISHASGSCGCTVPTFPKEPIEPGQSSYVDVEFNSENKGGLQEKTVFLLCNTIPGEKQLHIRADVK